ncbi:ABC transporter ATP-binding protein [Anaerobium acetethylicum]|uniref:Peptide/nickel transport system ATP-binding protein n=1 Tax=Anaerobium acetethylicum TaxID=1619234 RepID=A0A1D3TQH5_9FIRM|nr:ABC transporter ATP-binding protein [Anaerobium acetethylicum]SCP95829.1 peptide/nickel transport system ATP-binding protein [Anaerobium acetethylicum]
MSENILSVKNLVIHYETDEEVVEAVNNISFDLKKGEILGLVGETGAGKTTTALGIMGLLPTRVGHVIQGSIELDGENLLEKSPREMRKVRGKKISMIFQDPMTALNPVKTVGDQIAEVVLLHERCSRAEAMIRAQKMLAMVGIVPERYKDYPHQFSGGMKQRIVIAIALACEPELLIADEPTTALDVTIQAQILDMMRKLQKEHNTSMILITHDLGVVAEMCDHCAVMYAGELVEYGTVEDIFDNPQHPYTVALYKSIPSLDKDVDRLHVVPGMVTDPSNLPSGCSFSDRCDKKGDMCNKHEAPGIVDLGNGHLVKCLKYKPEVEEK